MKRCLAYKCYVSTSSVQILCSFNPELQLKDTESEIKHTLIDVLPESRWFIFATTLILKSKKVENNDKINMTSII